MSDLLGGTAVLGLDVLTAQGRALLQRARIALIKGEPI
jgi:hypothetical protein